MPENFKMVLSDIRKGGFGVVKEITGSPAFMHRLQEMGFVPGVRVDVVGRSPFGDPIHVRIKGSDLAIRKKDAANVIMQDYTYVRTDYTVALVGNPNSGKTSIFNKMSGLHEKVGNYGGVTIAPKEAFCTVDNRHVRIVDLPGTYSLSYYSPEEKEVLDYLLANEPDAVINVVDATNLERNLYLTLQLRELGLRTILALNMSDELGRSGSRVDTDALSSIYGVRVIPTVGRTGKGVDKLLEAVVREGDADNTRLLQNVYGQTSYIREVASKDPEGFFAGKYDNGISENVPSCRYDFIGRSLKSIVEGENAKAGITASIDRVLTHRVWGFPIFVLFLWLMFEATFVLGEYPMIWIEGFFGWLSGLVCNMLPESMFRDMLTDGIISGVGGVMVFLPNILILYFFISIMEDTGYMARAAYIMDRLMSGTGLNGKAFIPLIMGFGCNVPAVMATRTIEGRGNRLLTMLVSPLISCSARLPVYVVLVGAFFPERPAIVIVAVYLLGVLLAGVLATVFKRVFFRGDDTPFVIELPPYRIPTFMSVVADMWGRAKHYLTKMASIILVATIIIWALGYFPHGGQSEPFIVRIGHFIEPVVQPLGFDWRIGVGLLSGMAAKELVVSTMSILYGAGGGESLSAVLRDGLDASGEHVFTPAVAVSLIVFVLVYFPCVATVTAISKESGSWKWGLFVVVYTTLLAYILSFAAYRIALLCI